MKTLLLALTLALLAGTASADSTWTYTGNSTEGLTGGATNACKCALSGSLILDPSNNVLSYSFTDGAVTLDSSNSAMVLAPAIGDSGSFGLFTEWWMDITAPNGVFLLSEFYGSTGEATDSGTGGLSVVGNRGSWVDPVSAPEPRTIVLLAMGLVAISLISFIVKA